MTLRVLMVSDVYFPRINGVSTSIETFRRDLAACDVRVTLVAPDYGQAQHAPDTWRVPARGLPFDPEDRLMRWGPLRQAIDQAVANGIDLVHIQTPFAAHYAGVRIGRKHGIPVVATYHTHFEEYIQHYLPLLPRPVLRAAARRLARAQCNDLDAVIVPSRAMHGTLDGYGVTAPLHILPTGIPVGQFDKGIRHEFRARFGIADERPVALYVGRVAHEKNIGFLIDVAQRLSVRNPDFLLLIAGEGPALAGLQRDVQARRLDANVRFVGYLDRAVDLPHCYAAADVFVFSSRTETQGLVLLEAMAAGVPVYAFAEMGTHDIVEPGRGAIVAPQETDAFAQGLLQLLGDRARLGELSRDAREFAASWSSPGRARQMTGLYRSLVE